GLRPGTIGGFAVVHPIAARRWPLLMSRHVTRHQAGPLCGGWHTGCSQIAAALDPQLAAARPEPPARSPAAARGGGRPVALRDGSKVLIRPVQGTDAPLLADGFARLSPRSRRMRFLTTKKELSGAELRYF